MYLKVAPTNFESQVYTQECDVSQKTLLVIITAVLQDLIILETNCER